MKKYEMIPQENGMFRIKALVNISKFDIKIGDLGGLIEKEENLSHNGYAWISGNARVFGNAQVSGNARVSGDARVYGNAWISGDARVFGNAQVFGNARVYGDARVYGNAQVSGNAQVYGNAQVSGNARVSGDARVYGNAQVYGNALVVSPPICIANACEYHITAYNNFIQVGCKLHTIQDWPEILESRIYENLCTNYDKCVKTIHLVIQMMN